MADATGHEASDREQGRLQFKRPSATEGYYRDDVKTRVLFDGDVHSFQCSLQMQGLDWF